MQQGEVRSDKAEVIRLPDKCKLRWLHPPKTISTFCLSVQHACNELVFLDHVKVSNGHRMAHGCPILVPIGSAEGNRFHGPLDRSEMTKEGLSKFVTVLRDPTSRIISSFCDGVDLHYGLSKSTKDSLNDQFNAVDKWEWKRNKTLIKDNFMLYLKQPFIYGCYVRLLTGYACNDETVSHDKLTALLPEALTVIDSFLFAGISEEYNTTLKLFYRIAARNNITKTENLLSYYQETLAKITNTANGRLLSDVAVAYEYSAPHPVELARLSENSNSKSCESKMKDLMKKTEISFIDPFDSVVYTRVKEKLAVLKSRYLPSTEYADRKQ